MGRTRLTACPYWAACCGSWLVLFSDLCASLTPCLGAQLKAVLMAMYFGADHFVWAYQIGLTTDKKSGERWQKISLWSWAMGSVCTVVAEAYTIATLTVVQKDGESDQDYNKRVDEARSQINQKMLALVHGLVQVRLLALSVDNH